MIKFIKDLVKPYQKILIRFNTKNNGSDLVWRVFIDGEEHLASSIKIQGYIYDEKTFSGGEEKMNISCLGNVKWDGTKAKIKAVNLDRISALDGMAS
jgi:hypothetical protein